MHWFPLQVSSNSCPPTLGCSSAGSQPVMRISPGLGSLVVVALKIQLAASLLASSGFSHWNYKWREICHLYYCKQRAIVCCQVAEKTNRQCEPAKSQQATANSQQATTNDGQVDDDNAPLDNWTIWWGVRASCHKSAGRHSLTTCHIAGAAGEPDCDQDQEPLWVNRSPIVRQLIFHSNENARRIWPGPLRNEHGQGFVVILVWYKKVSVSFYFSKNNTIFL